MSAQMRLRPSPLGSFSQRGECGAQPSQRRGMCCVGISSSEILECQTSPNKRGGGRRGGRPSKTKIAKHFQGRHCSGRGGGHVLMTITMTHSRPPAAHRQAIPCQPAVFSAPTLTQSLARPPPPPQRATHALSCSSCTAARPNHCNMQPCPGKQSRDKQTHAQIQGTLARRGPSPHPPPRTPLVRPSRPLQPR